MTDIAARFLAFAFASAELLFEIDPEGRIVLAMGATRKLVGLGQEEMAGRNWTELFTAEGAAIVGALVDGLQPADRRGPVRAELRPLPGRTLQRYASFSACRLPQVAPNISCALSVGSALGAARKPRGAHGLHDEAGFLAASADLMAAQSGDELDLAFVELKGLSQAASRIDAAAAQQMVFKVAAAVRAESMAGHSAGLVSPDRFAMLRSKAESPDRLMERLTQACARAGAPVTATGVSVAVGDDPAAQNMRALKFALTTFINDGAISAGAAFGSILAETRAKADTFIQIVQQNRFRIVYQPIIALKTGDLHHFEALSRFEKGEASPFETIRMAEEMDLIQELDMAVAEQTMRKLAAPANRALKIAVNLSSRSLLQPGFVQALLGKTAAFDLAGRLIFEITESSAMDDLQTANAHIQALRSRGFAVCLDDFGAGAAALSYLRSLSVDTIKIDGQYVKDIGATDRTDVVVRHLADLCRELKVSTVAEMVETQAVADGLKAMGVDYAQGFHFGRPAAEPIYQRPSPAPSPMLARRMGARETWG